MSSGKSVMVPGNSSTGKHQIINAALIKYQHLLVSSRPDDTPNRKNIPYNFQDAISDVLVSESRTLRQPIQEASDGLFI